MIENKLVCNYLFDMKMNENILIKFNIYIYNGCIFNEKPKFENTSLIHKNWDKMNIDH